jgi:hypothetical protein
MFYSILKHAFEILQNAHDNRDKLHAMELFKDTHLVKLELFQAQAFMGKEEYWSWSY